MGIRDLPRDKWVLLSICCRLFLLKKTLSRQILEEFWSPKTINRLAIGDPGPF